MERGISSILYLIVLWLFTPCSVGAQSHLHASLLTAPVLSPVDSNRLSLRVDMSGFFKNNEYFSPVAVGQTLPGTASIYALGYQVSDLFKAELGAYFVKYSGRDPLEDLQAFIRLQYSITPYLHMVLGDLYGGVNHRLIEPIYQWERHFTANPESGFQMVLHTDRWFADLWVNWHHFIKRGDSELEALTFGTSVLGRLTGGDSRISLSLPLQLLIHHQGGQINTSNEPMVMLSNIATGLCSRLDMSHGWVKSVGLDVYVAGYWSRYSNEAFRPYDEGWGVYPMLSVDASPLRFMAGYWYAHKFYAFEGEPLFGSFNPFRPEHQLRKRNLLTCKFIFEKHLFKGVAVGAQMETYSDLNRGKIDYSFGVHLRFHRLFTLME